MIYLKILLGFSLIYQLGYWFIKLCKLFFKETDTIIISKPFEMIINFFIGEFVLVIFLIISNHIFGEFAWNTLYVISFILLPFSIFRFFKYSFFIQLNKVSLNKFFTFEIIFIVTLSLPALIYAFFHLLSTWDGRSIWFFHAKVFYYFNGFTFDFLKNPSYDFSHQQYPVFMPLLSVFFSKIIGYWSEIYNKSFLYFNWLGYLLIWNFILKKIDIKLIIRIIIISTICYIFRFCGVDGLMDIHSAMFFFMGYFVGLMIISNNNVKRNTMIFIMCILFSSTSLIKNEGMVFSVMFFLSLYIFTLFKRDKVLFKKLFIVFFLYLLIISSWYGFCKINAIQSTITSLNVFIKYSMKDMLFNRLPLILMHLFYKIVELKMFVFYLVFFIAIIMSLLKKAKYDLFQKFNLSIIVLFYFLIIAVYLNTPYPLYWHLVTSAKRVIFTPCLIILFLNSIVLNRFFNKHTR